MNDDLSENIGNKFYESWQRPTHSESFDGWTNLSTKNLLRLFNSFNEIRLLKKYQSSIDGTNFIEIGCATGELYRYMKTAYPLFKYHGFDISEPAIKRAQAKYPDGIFSVCDKSLSNLHDNCKLPDVLFSRDVVVHQVDPFYFLSKLLSIPSDAAILRIRTKDKGKSFLDPELSCQYYNNSWVPFMVMNLDETIEIIKKEVNFSHLVIWKDYKILGGLHNRFLPKDCYYPETGTSETTIYVKKTQETVQDQKVIIETMPVIRPKYSLFRKISTLAKKITKK